MNIALLLTFGNLICGLLTITLSFLYPEQAQIISLILLWSLLCDGLDGRFARKYNQTSLLWSYLDSLSDIISFGVAPFIVSMIVFHNNPHFIGLLISGILFVCAWAYRLARFHTIIHDHPQQKIAYYIGMPITTNGILLPLALQTTAPHNLIIVTILFLTSAYFMVSQHRFPKW